MKIKFFDAVFAFFIKIGEARDTSEVSQAFFELMTVKTNIKSRINKLNLNIFEKKKRVIDATRKSKIEDENNIQNKQSRSRPRI